MLDFVSEVMRGQGSVPTWGNILSLDFFLFSCSKDKNANIALAFSLVCEKLVLHKISFLYGRNEIPHF